MSKPDPEALPALHRYLEDARGLRDAWGVYVAHVMPKAAGYGQRVETKRAFYAGADWLYKRVLASVDDEEDAMRLLSELGRELQEYAEQIVKEAGS